MTESARHHELLRIVRRVRNRWRLKMVLRGLALALVGALAVFAFSAYGIDKFHFNPTAVLIFRIVAYTVLAGLVVRFTVLPLLKRASDERVAMYLEEHHPSLEGGLVSAVEFGAAKMSGHHSQAFVEHLVESAVDGCAAVDDGRGIDRKPILGSSGVLAGATVMAVAMLLFGPASIQRGAQTLLTPWASAEERSPYGIDVQPGDTTIARGSDLRLSALLRNFDSDRVELAVKRGAATQWERLPMTVDESTAEHAFLLFDLDERTEYFVEAAGVRSEVFEIEVADLPHVQQIDVEYHYPAYTRRKPQRQEDGGDVAALRGTRVVLEVTPTIPVDWGAILMDEQDTLPLDVSESGTLRGEFRVQQDGFYRILFRTATGKVVPGSPDYVIDVSIDEVPSAVITNPGRDLRVTNVEEIFTEIEAVDDYGVGRLELVYSVNGGSEQTVVLFEGTSIRQEVTASHTFFLEELELRPGDLVSYFARAKDMDEVTGPHEAVSDIYFLNIRPFDLEYRQTDQQPGGGGGAGLNSALSERQRQIVAATFNIVKDRASYSEKEYNENLATLALGQGRLREEVQTLLGRIRNRGVISLDTSFAEIATALEKAIESMQSAEQELGVRAPEEALPPEQQALQQLQRAEAVFRRVQVSRGGGGGAGGGANPNAEDLADLFNLEMDKLRNQYEQVQRGQQEATDAELDELMQKLRELARRQQQENERMRARAGQLQQQSGSGGGANQRQLAEEAEQVARRLERLAREQRRPDLERTARELREAAEEMRRAATNAGSNGGVAQGQSALQRLRDARRLLNENRTAGLQREIDDALRRAERLAEMQEAITEQVGRLGEGSQGETVRRLVERKEQMAAEVADLERQLDRASQETRRTQPAASRELAAAARGIRDDKLREKILYSRGVIQGRSQEYARNFEEQIGADLDALRERVRQARDAMGESSEQRLAQGVDRARELVNALESLDARIRERVEQGERDGRAGQEGQQGQQAQRGPQGQQGGQQGQQGQQGEEGQGQGGTQGGTEDGRQGPGGAVTAGGRGGFGPRDARQFRRELRERVGDADALRRQLRVDGIDVGDLENIIARLRALDDRIAYGDPRALALLRTEVIQGLKEFEYALRRELLAGEGQKLILGGSDDVPEGYRELVEEYYKALAEQRQR